MWTASPSDQIMGRHVSQRLVNENDCEGFRPRAWPENGNYELYLRARPRRYEQLLHDGAPTSRGAVRCEQGIVCLNQALRATSLGGENILE